MKYVLVNMLCGVCFVLEQKKSNLWIEKEYQYILMNLNNLNLRNSTFSPKKCTPWPPSFEEGADVYSDPFAL